MPIAKGKEEKRVVDLTNNDRKRMSVVFHFSFSAVALSQRPCVEDETLVSGITCLYVLLLLLLLEYNSELSKFVFFLQ